jgi:hypothetical protein
MDCLTALLDAIKDNNDAFAEGINGGIKNASKNGKFECLSALLDAINDDNKDAFAVGVIAGLRLAKESGRENCTELLTAFMQQHSITDDEDEARIRALGLTPVSNDAIKEAYQCPLCFEGSNESSDPFYALPCHPSHVCHRSCILEWVRRNEGHSHEGTTCPMCRARLGRQRRV